ncbi:MHYT domain-containing protein [Nonomuraea wenchangensis]|uniref:MHYT domain-containing protein n=1 Tax=Nonomuraea wenchangensis TaxID=568860 RepID=UPI0037A36D7B
MSPIDHFSSGPLTPVVAYVISTAGSMLGLMLTSRARLTGGREATYWLLGAALAIGGTGIWTMHFIAMLGFSVSGTVIRYDVPRTAASAVLAVVVVGLGLFLASQHGERWPYLLGGGLLTGLGVAGMHYLGMSAMNLSAHLSYDPVVVTLSVLIAIGAATAALWFTLRVSGALKVGAAALVMGVAVSGMHYTGMFAVSVREHTEPATPPGARGIDFLLPLIVGLSLLTVGLLLALLLSPSEKELRGEAEFRERLRGLGEEGVPEIDLFGTPRR